VGSEESESDSDAREEPFAFKEVDRLKKKTKKDLKRKVAFY
jgi:hypothetical protein